MRRTALEKRSFPLGHSPTPTSCETDVHTASVRRVAAPGSARGDPAHPAGDARDNDAGRARGNASPAAARPRPWAERHAGGSHRARQLPVARLRSRRRRPGHLHGPRGVYLAIVVRDQARDRQSRPDLELHRRARVRTRGVLRRCRTAPRDRHAADQCARSGVGDAVAGHGCAAAVHRSRAQGDRWRRGADPPSQWEVEAQSESAGRGPSRGDRCRSRSETRIPMPESRRQCARSKSGWNGIARRRRRDET